MVTTLELNRRGLRYAVSVSASETVANLAELDRRGLPYAVEVADGATMASRAALEARGLRYFVPVAVGATAASKASLAAQGLRYAVQVDADILPADRRTLEQQGLRYLVKVDSSGNSVATAAGGGLLLVDETNGFATDFLHAVDAERVALKTAGATTYSTVDGFYANAGTSPKMVYDVAGVLGWSPHNLLLQSQTFDHATWIRLQASVTANAAAAPDGTTTADKVVEDASSNFHGIDQSVAATTGTYSVYAKAAERSQIMLYSGEGKGDCFNLSTGAVFVGDVATTGGATIQSVGNGWYRCSIPVVGTTLAYVFIYNGASNYTGTAGSGVYLWGAQVNLGTVPTAYLPTTTAARFALALDYDPVTHAARGLLVEPQATNLLLRSSEFDNASWSKGAATITANATTAPDGSLTADKLVESATTAAHFTGQALAATTGVASIFAKAGERTSFLFYDVTANKGNSFNLSAGTTGTAAGITTTGGAVIQAVGNGWYRCSIPVTASTSVQVFPMNAGAFNYAGNGTSGVYLWGAQLETGTVATSPIPTLGATVTRAADQVSVTPASINYSATAGSWWVDVDLKANTGLARLIGNASASAPILIGFSSDFGVYDPAGANASKVVSSIVGSHKVAAAFQATDSAITADGLAVGTHAGATTNLLSPGANIGFGCDPASNQMNGYIRKLRYLPRRPTNAELQTMTA